MYKILKTILICLCIASCNSKMQDDREWQVTDGYISKSSSAIKLAEIVWLDVYGTKINDFKPFKAKLRNDSIWIVEGTLHSEIGGVPYIEIQKSDGRILKVHHGK